MDDRSEQDRMEKLEGRVLLLTVATCVSMVVSIMVGIVAVRALRDAGVARKERGPVERYVAEPKRTTIAGDTRSAGPSEDPLEAIQSANAIVLAEYEDRGARLHSVITEILWVSPDVTFDYEVGDEIGHPMDEEPHTTYGESQVMFCEGNPAKMKRSCPIYAGRLPAFGDMKIAKFRGLVEEHRKAQAAGQEEKATQ